jgi:hypothetical protein
LWLSAKEAVAKKNFLSAADTHERVRILNLRNNLGKFQTPRYLILTHRAPSCAVFSGRFVGEDDSN